MMRTQHTTAPLAAGTRPALLLTILATLALAGCGTTASSGDSDPVTTALLDSQIPLHLVPVNHTARYAPTITVEDVWAGNVSAYGGGGKITCCLSDSRDWRQPLRVSWRWGEEDDPVTKEISLQGENRTAMVTVAHPPTRLNRPNREQLPPQEQLREERFLCVIFRTLDTVELAFSATNYSCRDK